MKNKLQQKSCETKQNKTIIAGLPETMKTSIIFLWSIVTKTNKTV